MIKVEMKFIKYILSMVLMLAVVACGSDAGTNPDPDPTPGGQQGGDFITVVTPETQLMVTAGGESNIRNAKGAKTTDVLILEGTKTFECEIVRAEATWFKFRVPSDLTDGRYTLSVRRGDYVQKLYAVNITVQSISTYVPDKPGQGYTLKGLVYCGGKGIQNVLVTDGVSFTKTDANGHYWLASDKRYGVVYIVLPTGYNVKSQGAMPQFWAITTDDSTTTDVQEQHNFELLEKPNDNHTMLVVTDIHLANRNMHPQDLKQFRDGWVKEVIEAYSGRDDVYCLNLGDFAWDIYWYSRKFDVNNVAEQISGLPFQFWSTMGNHDNDGHANSDGSSNDTDLVASAPFRKALGPTHISMNIGKVHYILLDDILYKNSYPGETANDPLMGMRDYTAGFRPDIVNWVREDLSYVSKDTPIVVGMHSPLCNWDGKSRNPEFRSQADWDAFVSLFADFNEVEFISGHTHQNRMHSIPGYGTNMYEHNIAALCGLWWATSEGSGGTSGTTGKVGALNLCAEGSPAGYYVYEVNGTNRKWHYKATGEPASRQFKSYDMNEVKKYYDNYAVAKRFLDTQQCTNTAGGGVGTVTWTKAEYGYEEEPNTVWLNVWGYEDGSFANYGNWEITVTENGKKLDVVKFSGKHDPLVALVNEIYKFDQSGSFSTNSQSTRSHTHMFKVVASSANSTLTISVKDRFGNVYQEKMERPKKFFDGNIANTWTLE